MSSIAVKPKVAAKTDNFDEKHEYKCLRCGKIHQNPVGNFYKSQWSEAYQKNDKYVPLCQPCVNEIFDTYSRRYKSDETACILTCHILDIPFYHSLYNSIAANNNIFSIGLYLRQINGKQYQYKTFNQTILEGELNKTKTDVVEERESKWEKADLQNKKDVIGVVGYDPFDGYLDADRKFLFNELVKYFDDDTSDDAYKLSQIIQIVINNNQIRKYDLQIATLDAVKDSKDIETIIRSKTSLINANDKIAKENEISVKNRSNKDVGRSTLTYLMKDLREKNFFEAEANYYDQLRSPGTQWAADMSFSAIKQNGFFDENDKQEILEMQRDLISQLQSELDDEKEKSRMLSVELQGVKRVDSSE